MPGLIRTFSTICAATNAALGTKCISATKGVSYPFFLIANLIFSKFSASFVFGAVNRTSFPPASIILIASSTLALVSSVDAVVMDCVLIE